VITNNNQNSSVSIFTIIEECRYKQRHNIGILFDGLVAPIVEI
jgi:hypothetical protein